METNRKKTEDYILTGREKDILTILWNSEQGLIASEVVTKGKPEDNLTINTVQAILKKLLRRELIKIDQIVYSGTVLSRSYVPTLTEAEFETQKITAEINELERFGITPAMYFAKFFSENKVKLSNEEAEELKKLIEEK